MSTASFSLALASTVLTLLAVEGLLRLTMDPSDLVSGRITDPARHQWHNELRFWQRYRDSDTEFSSHDVLLGWDNRFGGTRVRDRDAVGAATGLRAVSVGDSFVFGNDVAADENFSAVLERDWQVEVLNMGVPGYGIDQSALKYEHFGAPYAPDVVLFGIYVHDYERSTVAFTHFAKPLFVEQPDGFVIANQPVPDPRSELERIGADFEDRWYLPTLAGDISRRLGTGAGDDFFDRGDRLVRHILSELKRHILPGQRLLVIHIPSGDAFAIEPAEHREMHERLIAIYDALAIEHVDLAAAFQDAADPITEFYVTRSSGSPGHLNPTGHARVAELIAARLGFPAR